MFDQISDLILDAPEPTTTTTTITSISGKILSCSWKYMYLMNYVIQAYQELCVESTFI